MKKYLTGFVALCVLPISAFAQNEKDLSKFDDRVPLSEKLLREYKTENPNVVYRDRNKMERIDKWYIGLNADLSFLSWKNEYSGVDSGSESFNFKPVIGVDLAVGYRFNKDWRADLELGYGGKFSETETEYFASFPVEKTEFSLETYRAIANVYYDIAYGFYAGLGAGLSITHLEADNSSVDNGSKTNLSPIGAAMLGWSYMLDEKIDFDLRYRFAVFKGGDMNIGGVKVDSGTIMNNSISAGIRYHF